MRMIDIGTLSALLLIAHLLSGCAGINSSAMTVKLPTSKSRTATADIAVVGHALFFDANPEKNGLNETQKAIQESAYTQLFNKPASGSHSDLKLNVYIHQFSSPIAGLTMDVSLEISWLLTSTKTGAILYRKSIRTSQSKTLGDAIVGANRLRLAFESAMRENIRMALEDMNRLDY